MLGPVPRKMLNPREVGCQVDGEMLYVRGIACGRTYVTPPKSETEPNPNLARQVDNLGSDCFRGIQRLGFVDAYLTIWFARRHVLGPAAH